MINRATLVWSSLALASAVGLFLLKYEVQEKADALAGIRAEIAETKEAIKVLEAEWAYRNRPERLSTLVERHLDLVPVAAPQLDEIESIPVKLSLPLALAEERE